MDCGLVWRRNWVRDFRQKFKSLEWEGVDARMLGTKLFCWRLEVELSTLALACVLKLIAHSIISIFNLCTLRSLKFLPNGFDIISYALLKVHQKFIIAI